MSEQGDGRPPAQPLPRVALSPRTARTIAAATGVISIILWTLAVLLAAREASAAGNIDGLLRSLAIISSLTTVTVALFARDREALRGIHDRQEVILDRLTQVAADEATKHRDFTEDLVGRQHEFQKSVDDARWRVNRMTAAMERTEAWASEFNAKADQLDDRMEALGLLLMRISEVVEERMPLPPSGQIAPFKRPGS